MTSIHNGIANLRGVVSKRPHDPIRLITVGTVINRKGQYTLLKALKTLRDYSFEVLIVGDGPDLDKCQHLSNSANMNSKISFLGKRNDIPQLLQSSDIFILNSTDEGLPIAIIEALRAGLCILSTDVGGIAETIHDNGLLIPPNDQASLIDALKQLFTN